MNTFEPSYEWVVFWHMACTLVVSWVVIGPLGWLVLRGVWVVIGPLGQLVLRGVWVVIGSLGQLVLLVLREMEVSRTPLSEAEFEEIMNRNRAISSSAISRAVSDASAGERNRIRRSKTLKI